MDPKTINAKAVQDTLLAGLRLLTVIIAGGTTLLALIGKRDLTGLIAWVQSDAFVPFASATLTALTAAWGLWKTFDRSHKVNTSIATQTPVPPKPDAKTIDLTSGDIASLNGGPPTAMLALPLLLGLLMLAGCATAGDVRLASGKAFLTAQIALKSAQQTTLAVCTTPPDRLAAPCQRAFLILHEAAQAEAAGFTAQQAGNAADLQAAVLVLMDLPPQLVALGILEAR